MRVLALVFGLLAAGAASAQTTAFRDERLAPIEDPLRVEFAAAAAELDAQRLGQAITLAAEAADWQIVSQVPGRLELRHTVSDRYVAFVALSYDATGATIRYVNSANLLYAEGAQTLQGASVTAIHRNYNIWVRQLAAALAARFEPRQTAAVEAAPPPVEAPQADAQQAEPQPAPPRDPAAARSIVFRLSGTNLAMESSDWQRFSAEWFKSMGEAASRIGAQYSLQQADRPLAGAPGTLVSVYVNRFRFVAPGARFAFGVMTGNAHMDVTVTLTDLSTGTLLATRSYKTASRGSQGIFSPVTDKQVRAVADQIATEVAASGTQLGRSP